MRWLARVALLCAVSVLWAADTQRDLAAGTTLKHFTQIDDRIFGGSKPTKDAEFEFLKARGVKYILQAQFLPGQNKSERRKAAQFGMEYRSVPMNASFIPPRQKHVDEILRLMRTKQPMYIHCVLGRDRTSLLSGLYKIYFQGMSKERAYILMKEEGFRDVFFLHGLKTYFDKHTRMPSELSDLVR